MKILLIPPKNNYPDPMPRVDIFGQGFPYIAGALKKAGHEVVGINMNHLWCESSAPAKLASLIREALAGRQPELVGLGGLSGDYLFIRDAIRFVREAAPDIPIVCGGGIITYDREYVFENLRPDFALSGEAETSVVALADALEKGGNVAAVPNLARWLDGKPSYARLEYGNVPIENLPLPDYDPFDYERFLQSFNQTESFYCHTRPRPRIMPLSLARSCPFGCTFCCHTVGPRYRTRPVDDAVREIAHFYDRYHFNILFVYDEVLSLKRDRVREFSAQMKALRASGMDFDWTCDLRVGDVDGELLGEMKDAGCAFIGYGLESASQEVLDSMKKGTTVEQIQRAVRLTSEAGIGIQGNFIFGDVAETPETARETMDFYRAHCRDLIVFLSHVMPYPGSEIFQHCIDRGIISDKQRYYDQVSPWGALKINMTRTPDSVVLGIIDEIEEPMRPEHFVRQFREAAILSCARTGEFADPELPLPLRRLLYDITARCPLCAQLSGYLCPLSATMPDRPEIIRTYCTNCHKRFVMLPRDDLRKRRSRSMDALKRTVLSLLPQSCRPALLRLYRSLRREPAATGEAPHD